MMRIEDIFANTDAMMAMGYWIVDSWREGKVWHLVQEQIAGSYEQSVIIVDSLETELGSGFWQPEGTYDFPLL